MSEPDSDEDGLAETRDSDIGETDHRRSRSPSTIRTINRQPGNQHGLLMLFNCNIAESSGGRSVYDALGDQAPLWPSWLSDIGMTGRRELAVPLAAGLSAADRTANVLVVQLVHVHFSRFAQHALPRTLELCNPVDKVGDALLRFRRSSVGVVVSNTDMDPFQSWPAEESWGIYQLVDFRRDMQSAITQALRDAAEALLQESGPQVHCKDNDT